MKRALVAALLLGACQSLLPWPARLPPCPGPLPSTETVRGEFTLREHVRVRSHDGAVDAGLTAVVEKRGEHLVLIALTPLGAKAFAVEQTGGETRVTEYLGRANPVPPLHLLRDLHALRLGSDRSTEPRVHSEHARCGYDITLVSISDSRSD